MRFGGGWWVIWRPSGRGAQTSWHLSGALGAHASLPTAVVLLAETNQAFWPDVGRCSKAELPIPEESESYFMSPESHKGRRVCNTLQK